MSEGVEVVISADDQATKVVDDVADNIDARVKRIKEVGGRAKASTEFIGQLASSLGGSELASYASSLAGLTEKISAFSEISKAGGAGAAAFKLGIAGIVAVGAFKVGEAIGNAVFQTQKWKEALEEATKEAQRLDQAVLRAASRGFELSKAEIELLNPDEQVAATKRLLDQLEQEIIGKQQQINERLHVEEDFNTAWFGTPEERAKFRDTSDLEAQLDQLRQQQEELRNANSERAKELQLAKETAALRERNRSYIEGLQNEVELLKASKEERAAIEAAQRASGDTESAQRIESLLREKQAIEDKKEAEKIAADEAKKRADEQKKADEDAKKRAEDIEKVKQNEINRLKEQEILLNQGKEAARAFALEQQGLDEATAKRLAAEQERIDKMASRQQDPGTQQAVQGRLLTRGTQDRTKELIDVNKEIKKVLEGIEKNTEWRSQSELKLEVVGK